TPAHGGGTGADRAAAVGSRIGFSSSVSVFTPRLLRAQMLSCAVDHVEDVDRLLVVSGLEQNAVDPTAAPVEELADLLDEEGVFRSQGAPARMGAQGRDSRAQSLEPGRRGFRGH